MTKNAPTGGLLQAEAARTENDAVIEVAKQAADVRLLAQASAQDLYLVGVPDGMSVEQLDLRAFTDAPRRKKGSVTLQDAASFVAYVQRHTTAATLLYANQDAGTITAILNDHAADAAGWGDFRAVMALKPTKEWQHWAGKNDRLLPQADFAEHIEAGLLEIVAPPAADMLELAQHFEAKSKVDYKSVKLLASGERQFVYEETVEAKAGQKGTVEIPREFTLGIAPYEGSDRYQLTARLRYRLNEGALTIGYSLVRPHDVIRTAFGDVLTAVAAGVGQIVLRGHYGA